MLLILNESEGSPVFFVNLQYTSIADCADFKTLIIWSVLTSIHISLLFALSIINSSNSKFYISN